MSESVFTHELIELATKRVKEMGNVKEITQELYKLLTNKNIYHN